MLVATGSMEIETAKGNGGIDSGAGNARLRGALCSTLDLSGGPTGPSIAASC